MWLGIYCSLDIMYHNCLNIDLFQLYRFVMPNKPTSTEGIFITSQEQHCGIMNVPIVLRMRNYSHDQSETSTHCRSM